MVPQNPPSLVHRSRTGLRRGLLEVLVQIVVQHLTHPYHPLELVPLVLLQLVTVHLDERGSGNFASLLLAFLVVIFILAGHPPLYLYPAGGSALNIFDVD
ncbi:hypothetical protein GALMADRAFT_148881 [Galerina marginata CBS 339.88]|uniref:Uncharacterized protein n=1 Tax=Galerina marginata (strain CBS 339.88) TaxID=685588 RepID=A0A067SBR9_GALM3|nr:hypothetical protein GALMADRAFT_148881 [Galerina marginata CBS 339.88]